MLACSAERDVLRVGLAPIYAPFAFAEDGELQGVEVDFAKRLTAELQRDLELVELEFSKLIPALLAGEIDVIMSGMSITPERSEKVRFSEPYQQVGQMALIRSAEFGELRGPQAMERPDARVGYMRGTTAERFVASRLTAAQAVPFDTIDSGIEGLRAGRVDFFVNDAPTIWRIVGGFESHERELTGLYRPLTDEHLAWAVRPDDAQLLAALNASLTRWREEGILDELLSRWIRVRRITVQEDFDLEDVAGAPAH